MSVESSIEDCDSNASDLDSAGGDKKVKNKIKIKNLKLKKIMFFFKTCFSALSQRSLQEWLVFCFGLCLRSCSCSCGETKRKKLPENAGATVEGQAQDIARSGRVVGELWACKLRWLRRARRPCAPNFVCCFQVRPSRWLLANCGIELVESLWVNPPAGMGFGVSRKVSKHFCCLSTRVDGVVLGFHAGTILIKDKAEGFELLQGVF